MLATMIFRLQPSNAQIYQLPQRGLRRPHLGQHPVVAFTGSDTYDYNNMNILLSCYMGDPKFVMMPNDKHLIIGDFPPKAIGALARAMVRAGQARRRWVSVWITLR